MSRIFRALTAEPWAIEPSWLPLLAALAQRNHSAPEIEAARGWLLRDYEMMAGPGAQRLAGAQRAYVIDGVAVLPVTGPIFPRANMMTDMSGATSLATLGNDYRAALDSPDVGAIMLLVDSPGGAVSGVAAFADAVSAGSKKKHTMAHVSGTGASAAYWAIIGASEIAMERTGMVGSIGVVAMLAKQVGPDGDGMIDVEVVSSNAPNKRPDPTTEGGAGEVRGTLDAIEGHFIADVAKGRNVSAATVASEFGAGGVKVGDAARKAGMVDKVQSYETSLNSLRRMVANNKRMAALKK